MKKFLVTRVRVFPFPKARFAATSPGRSDDPAADGRILYRMTRSAACKAAADLVTRGFDKVEVLELPLVLEWCNYVDFTSRLDRLRREQQTVKNQMAN